MDDWFGASALSRRLGTSVVRAAVLCAWYYLDSKDLSRFVLLLTERESPVAGDSEGAAKMLRGYLIGTLDDEKVVFLKTCGMLGSFIGGTTPGRVNALRENPFPFSLA